MKHKVFSQVKLTSEPISKARHTAGVWILLVSVAIEFVLVVCVLLAHFILGNPEVKTSIFGLSFQLLAHLYVAIEIGSALGIVLGVYLLGAGFAERLKKVFTWLEE